MTRKEEYFLVTENSKIVDDFVIENRRIPTQSEFVKLGVKYETSKEIKL